ncbi:hypothetical protein, partial [Paraprevotella clara]|uniref:hypothetical protein n=1 Tax=Paraprevotella clara TaxID=454154 RepID=UPI002FD9F5AE
GTEKCPFEGGCPKLSAYAPSRRGLVLFSWEASFSYTASVDAQIRFTPSLCVHADDSRCVKAIICYERKNQ